MLFLLRLGKLFTSETQGQVLRRVTAPPSMKKPRRSSAEHRLGFFVLFVNKCHG